MKILIVVATQIEVNPLLELTNAPTPIGNKSSAIYNGLQIDFLITGVGMVATTFHTCKALGNQYDFAMNIGICGSFNSNLDLGDTINIIQDEVSELGAEDDQNFLSLSSMGFEGSIKIENNTTIKNSVLENIPKVTGITVNTVHGNEENITKVFDAFHPYTESMEGAAFMYACDNENVPYAQIRAVSNYVEKRNTANWNIPLAIEKVNKRVKAILDDF